jgi:hypothetical protein
MKDIERGREKLEKQIKMDFSDKRIIDAEEIQKPQSNVVLPVQIHRHIIEHEPVPEKEDHRIIQGKINKVALSRYLFPLCVGTFFGGMLWSWGGLVATMVVVLIFVGIIGAVMSS